MPMKNPKKLGNVTLRERLAAWARMNLGVYGYLQGEVRDVMIWIQIGCGAHTLLSHGDIDRALEEAEKKLDAIKDDLRAQAALFKARESNARIVYPADGKTCDYCGGTQPEPCEEAIDGKQS